MHKGFAVIIFGILLIFACGSVNVRISNDYPAGEKSRIAVIGFDIKDKKTGKDLPQINSEFSDAISPFLLKAGFSVIERRKINLLFDETRFSQSGLVVTDKAVEFGRISKVKYLVFGNGSAKLSGSGNTYFLHSITLKMVSVETGEIILAASWSGAGVRPIGVANRIGKEILKRLSNR